MRIKYYCKIQHCYLISSYTLVLLPQHHAAAQRLRLVLVHPKTPLARCYAKKKNNTQNHCIWQYCRKQSCISKVTDYMDYSVSSISNFYESMIVLFPPFCIKEVIKWLVLKCNWKGRSEACLEMNAVSVQASYAEVIGKWRCHWTIPS